MRRWSRRFCSMRCRDGHLAQVRRHRPPRACSVCGKQFNADDRPNRQPQRFCSKRCAQLPLGPRKCRHCKAEFQPRRTAQPYCSVRCHREATQAVYVTVTCAHCAREFRKRGSNRRQRFHFCNKVCQHKFTRGENSHQWRGGHDANRGPNWIRLAAKIRDRDGHVCQRCGTTEAENGQKLDVDHIIPWRELIKHGVEVANDPENLVSLCRSCHRWKSMTVEKAWLERGDCLAMSEYQRRVKLLPLFSKVREEL